MVKILQTERLLLRPYRLEDAPRVTKIANDERIAATTLAIPHPYHLEDAERWIKQHPAVVENGEAYPYAIVKKAANELMGTVTIRVDQTHHNGELGYWIGTDYWGKGFTTEAVRRIMDFGFHELRLQRIFAPIMRKNTASAKVLQKAGLFYEGTLRNHILKWGQYEDLDYYGKLVKDNEPAED
ncbi:GNAT family N-acetyltransferase [Alteribacillus sp. HJP-4]|uniref:GNAT family N-acetyltransferase n=1 Tax=Alteribacillus sp. HJP-4 TaxID=2775394 RepID=UPI0035CD3C0D